MYRNVLLALHIAGAAGWLGCNFTQLFLTPWFAGRGGEVAASWFEATSRLARRYYNVVGAVLTISGILLVIESGYEWSAGFIAVGFTVVIVGAVLGITYFGPDGDRSAAAVRAGEPVDVRRYLTMVAIDTTLVLTAVLAMVDRWQA